MFFCSEMSGAWLLKPESFLAGIMAIRLCKDLEREDLNCLEETF
jgi:hypothetical protein